MTPPTEIAPVAEEQVRDLWCVAYREGDALDVLAFAIIRTKPTLHLGRCLFAGRWHERWTSTVGATVYERAVESWAKRVQENGR